MHYHFCEKKEIKRGIEEGQFVEFAEVHGNYYGTRLVFFWWLYALLCCCGLLYVYICSTSAIFLA